MYDTKNDLLFCSTPTDETVAIRADGTYDVIDLDDVSEYEREFAEYHYACVALDAKLAEMDAILASLARLD